MGKVESLHRWAWRIERISSRDVEGWESHLVNQEGSVGPTRWPVRVGRPFVGPQVFGRDGSGWEALLGAQEAPGVPSGRQ